VEGDSRFRLETRKCVRLDLPTVYGIASAIGPAHTHRHATADSVFADTAGAATQMAAVAGARIIERAKSSAALQ
jgi:hypothetical protein